MRSILCAALLLTLLSSTGCTIYAEKQKPAWEGATSGEQYERLFWDSVKAKNWRDVDAHLSGTVVTMAGNEVRDRQRTGDHLRQVDLIDYSLGDLKTETAGADIIVTYTITLHGKLNGKDIPDRPMRMMSVWQRAKRGMILVAHTTILQGE